MTVEYGKTMDVSAFDWDDTALIKAFDRTMEADEEDMQYYMERARREAVAKSWKIGDYCQAFFEDDGLFYEATVVGMYGDTCIIEFLGYGDRVEVPIDTLEDSLGKKARQRQRKHVKKAMNLSIASDTDYSIATEIKNATKAAKSTPLHHHHNMAGQQVHNACSSNQPLQQTFQPPPAFNYPAPHQHACNHAPHPSQPAVPVQGIGANNNFLPAPPIPSIPINTSVTKDPSLTPMLVSWYMAGYYTGLHQSQKPSCCSAPPKPQCCGHHIPTHCGAYY